MHPYSEYLQQYVYDQQGLQKGGKLKEDFRMTTWGKLMRKLWLDELPMLYNWLRGELQIVGIRPLSFHYLDLSDDELKELRKKVRPGLIPPPTTQTSRTPLNKSVIQKKDTSNPISPTP